LRSRARAHRIEVVGERLREMMSWIRDARKDSSEPNNVVDYPFQRSGAV
jgi:ketol-acid reductoisomerase